MVIDNRDFTSFLKLIEPFTKAGAIKEIYYEEVNVKQTGEVFRLHLLLGDVTTFVKSVDYKWGEVTKEGAFCMMINFFMDVAGVAVDTYFMTYAIQDIDSKKGMVRIV